MAILDKFCPNCMNIIKRKDEKCSNCGMLVSEMKKLREKTQNNVQKAVQEEPKQDKEVKTYETGDGGVVVDTSSYFNNEPAKEAEPKTSALEENFNEDEVGTVSYEENKPKRHKHKRRIKNEDAPEYTVDKDGSYNIDTSDVTFTTNVTPSVKKARGDVKKEKIEWWEIYKWADRILARRKINKEVKKAATKIPEKIDKAKMVVWCIFFGWLGIHNFYAKNNKKGWFVVISDIISLTVISVPVLYEIMGVFVGGGLGFIVLALWITDLFGLFFNKYRYRISKEEFISNLNVETRAKLGDKYIKLDKAVFKEKEEKRLSKKKSRKEKKLEKLDKKLN